MASWTLLEDDGQLPPQEPNPTSLLG
jgi:hypothetical protein